MKNNLILLVDDEDDIREVLSIYLADMGFAVAEAGNGNEAMEKFRQLSPQIVITDIKMPDTGGIELLKEIKQSIPDTEVIMITGHGDMGLAVESLRHRAIDFIRKPINTDELEIAVRRARESITSRRQLREYTEKLESLILEKTHLQNHLASLGLMIGSISHGIKGVLTRLDGGVYLLESAIAKKTADSLNESVDIVKDAISRIKTMVFDILYYAKDRKLDLVTTDISEFMEDLSRGVEQKIRAAGIDYGCSLENVSGTFEVDGELLQSALVNIIDNAVDACAVDTEKKEHVIRLKAAEDDENVYIGISDNGTGMDLETREKIFTLFFSTKGNKGTGFGLFITDSIVKQHNGKISVNSIPGKGTDFHIAIPRKKIKDASPAESQRKTSPHRKRRKHDKKNTHH